MRFNRHQRGIGGVAIFVIIAVVALLGGAAIYMVGKNATNTSVQTVTKVPEPGITNVTPTGIVVGDTSDTGLANDSAKVDTMLKAADQDSANVNTGLNDQQGNLSEQ